MWLFNAPFMRTLSCRFDFCHTGCVNKTLCWSLPSAWPLPSPKGLPQLLIIPVVVCIGHLKPTSQHQMYLQHQPCNPLQSVSPSPLFPNVQGKHWALLSVLGLYSICRRACLAIGLASFWGLLTYSSLSFKRLKAAVSVKHDFFCLFCILRILGFYFSWLWTSWKEGQNAVLRVREGSWMNFLLVIDFGGGGE